MKQISTRSERSDGIRTRKAILNAAANLATVQGLEGLSIGSLAEHIGMSKSGLYAHFRSKEDLQLATIETALEIFAGFVVAPTLDIEDPVARLEALCERFLEHLRQRIFPGGCFFAAATAELDTHPGPVRERIAEVQVDWMQYIVRLVREAQARSLIDPGEDPEQLGFEIDAYLLMANMAFVLFASDAALERAWTALQHRLTRARIPAESPLAPSAGI